MAKKMIYFDNYYDSFPKAPNIYKKSAKFMETSGVDFRLGDSLIHSEAEDLVKKSKIKLSNIFNILNPQDIFFTNTSESSLAFLFRFLLKKGDHVITTNFESDFVMNQFKLLEKSGVQVSYIKSDKFGNIDSLHFLWAIRETTKLIYCSHSSPYNDSILPIKELGLIAKKHHIPFALNTSHSAGIIDIDVEEFNISLLISTLNSYMLCPQGASIFYINKEFLELTKAFSESNATNSNLQSVSTLYFALEYYEERERKKDLEKLTNLKKQVLKNIQSFDFIKILSFERDTLPIITFSIIDEDPDYFYNYLLNNYQIVLTKANLFYKEAFETFGFNNAFKISFGLFNTLDDVKILIKAFKQFHLEIKKS